MSAAGLARLAIALLVLALSGEEAGAGGRWWFDKDYPPMHAPSYHPRRGPIWTPNGWSYPQTFGQTYPLPYVEEEYVGRQFDDRRFGDRERCCRPHGHDRPLK